MTPASLPLPPDPFPNVNTQILRSGTILHRTHASTFRPTQFNPCKGEATRFAPFTDVSGDCVPTLYAATNREAAAFESIFHDIAPGGSFKTVRLSTVEARAVSKISPRRDLVVARLFSPDLKLWGLSRTDLIETPKLVYDQTVLWAKAIHQARPDLDGLIWTSRQCDPEQCVILFEDRISESEFDIIEQVDVSADGNLLLELRAFGQRAGITIIA